MNVVNDDVTHEQTEQESTKPVPHRRGRPKGSKNKPKFGLLSVPQEYSDVRQEGWEVTKKIGRPKSIAAHRKWQRDFVLPQFVLSRKQAQDLLLKFLRSKPGKAALSAVISDGFVGIKKLPDIKLGEFLVSTSLLSRYPHQIVIRGS